MSGGYFETKLEDCLDGCSDGKGDRTPLDAERGNRERKLEMLVASV